jgi:hypothetical protein
MCCFWMLHHIASSLLKTTSDAYYLLDSIVVLIKSRILQNTVSHNIISPYFLYPEQTKTTIYFTAQLAALIKSNFNRLNNSMSCLGRVIASFLEIEGSLFNNSHHPCNCLWLVGGAMSFILVCFSWGCLLLSICFQLCLESYGIALVWVSLWLSCVSGAIDSICFD